MTNAVETLSNQLSVLIWSFYHLCNLTHIYCNSKTVISGEPMALLAWRQQKLGDTSGGNPYFQKCDGVGG